MHRGILRQVTVVAAVGGGRYEAAQEAAQQVVRAMRRRGVIAEAERVPLPLPSSSTARSRWAITATAEFENSVVTVSALGQAPALVGPEQGDRVAERLSRFLERRGALDSVMAERLLLPAVLCAGGLGARAGTPPSCHYTTSEVTGSLLQLATTVRQALPVRAVVDGAEGEEGVVVVAPFLEAALSRAAAIKMEPGSVKRELRRRAWLRWPTRGRIPSSSAPRMNSYRPLNNWLRNSMSASQTSPNCGCFICAMPTQWRWPICSLNCFPMRPRPATIRTRTNSVFDLDRAEGAEGAETITIKLKPANA